MNHTCIDMRRTRRAAAAAALLAVIACLLLAGTASAQESQPLEIDRFDAEYTVEPSGELAVRESIEVTLPADRRGIIRELPLQTRVDGGKVRVYRLSDVAVSSPDDIPTDFTDIGTDSEAGIRIGDPDTFLDAGTYTYVIEYRIEGALNGFPGEDGGADEAELFWQGTGTEWLGPIDEASATISLPGEALRVRCLQGPPDADEECEGSTDGQTARVAATRPLPESEGMTFAVRFPAAAVESTEPILIDEADDAGGSGDGVGRPPIDLGDVLAPVPLGLGALASVGAVVGSRTLRRRWDDPDALGAVTVEYHAPEGLRPGQGGALDDEQVGNREVTATLVDLAQRGYLSIGKEKKGWRFVPHPEAPAAALIPYEMLLLQSLFPDGRTPTTTKKLRGKFASKWSKVSAQIRDASDQWLENPGAGKQMGVLWTVITAVLGFAIFISWLSPLTVVLVPLLIGAGYIRTQVAPKAARPNAEGIELTRKVHGYKEFLATADRGPLSLADERAEIVRALPWALVFGLTDEWTKRLEVLDIDPQREMGWYYSPVPLHPMAFTNELTSMGNGIASDLSYSPSSSSAGGGSGFSGGGSVGGGGGGGGGGSW